MPAVIDAARRIDVDRNVFFRVLRFQEQKLGGDQVGDVIVDRRADKNDVVLQQPRVNVICALAAIGLLDDHGDERCCMRRRESSLFLIGDLSGALGSPNQELFFTFGDGLDSGVR